EAHVTDQSRREMEASAGFVGTRGKTIANAEPERYLYYQGDTAKIVVRTADYSGHPVAEKVTLKFIEQRWKVIKKPVVENGYSYETTEYVSQERELASTDVTTDSQGKAAYEYPVPVLGYIHILAIV